ARRAFPSMYCRHPLNPPWIADIRVTTATAIEQWLRQPEGIERIPTKERGWRHHTLRNRRIDTPPASDVLRMSSYGSKYPRHQGSDEQLLAWRQLAVPAEAR
ncbi:hypothetical protein, partial [Sphingobium yanoikuyae]